jgi:hypothetical protein
MPPSPESPGESNCVKTGPLMTCLIRDNVPGLSVRAVARHQRGVGVSDVCRTDGGYATTTTDLKCHGPNSDVASALAVAGAAGLGYDPFSENCGVAEIPVR